MPTTPSNAAKPTTMTQAFRRFMPLPPSMTKQSMTQQSITRQSTAYSPHPQQPTPYDTSSDAQVSAQSIVCQGDNPMVLASIFDAATAIAIWQRHLQPTMGNSANQDHQFSAIAAYVNALILQKTAFTTQAASGSDWRLQRVIALDEVHTRLEQIMPDVSGFSLERRRFIQDVADLMEMLGTLMDCRHIGLRLAILQHSMCPRFHTDPILCRLLVTYQGAGTQWLQAEGLGGDRQPLTAAQLPDSAIAQLNPMDVAIIKGVQWQTSIAGSAPWQHPPCWHRSPTSQHPRLLLSLDPIADDQS